MSISSRSVGFYGETDAIDAKSTGTTTLVTTGTVGNVSLYPLSVAFETVSSSSVTKTATVSVGSNSPNYDNIIPCHKIDVTTGRFEHLIPTVDQLPKVAHSGDIRVNVYDAATGTALTFKAVINVGQAWD